MAFWDLADVSALLGVSFKSDYLSIPCLRQTKGMFCLCLRDQVLLYSHSKGTVLDWTQLHVTSHLGSVVIFNEATPELPSLIRYACFRLHFEIVKRFLCCVVWNLSRILPLLFKSPPQVGHKIFKFVFLYQFRWRLVAKLLLLNKF